MGIDKGKGKAADTVPSNATIHPFLRGNFMPVTEEYISHSCLVEGKIPAELLGGQYIRNGGNPVHPPGKGRHYHWYVAILPALPVMLR
jgi:carotenoid cleavage dioxygenase-like enzyme